MTSHPFRRRIALCATLIAIAVVPLRAAPPDAPAPVTTATVSVRHAKASHVVAQLINREGSLIRFSVDRVRVDKAPEEAPNLLVTLPGLATLSADDSAHRINASGDKASITRLRELVKLLDQPAPEMKLRVAITTAPYVPGSDATPTTTTLVKTEVKISNLETVEVPLNANGVVVQSVIRPRINGDRSVFLSYTTDSRWRLDNLPYAVADNRQATQNIRRLKLGEVQRTELTALNTGANGDGPRRQYYLELTPLAVKIP